jgi:hypothetical protein
MNAVRNLAALVVAVTALVVPAAASAHPSVYTGEGRIVTSLTGVTPVTVGPQVRHMVTNHGFTTVLRETNGESSKGVVSYAMVPGAYRNQPGFEPGPAGTRTRLLSEADSGAQAHATCKGVPELTAEANILAWQGSDPFYNYIPFQATSAGLEDNPADWLDDVLALTNVDLTQVTDAAAACAGLGGTYVPADETQSSIASLAAGSLHPLEEEIVLLNEDIDQLVAELDAANAALAVASGQVSAKSGTDSENQALKAEVAKLKLESTRLRITSVANGSVKLAGPAGKAVTLKITCSKSSAKKLKLKSRKVATASGKIGADASATIPFKASSKALKNGSLKVTVTATSEDRLASTSATLKR